MEKKKKGLIALVILLVVAIGVGFAAASTDSVTINGSASALAGNFDIQFDTTTTVSTTTSGTSTTVDAAYTDTEIATMTVSKLQKVGDNATATYTIKNASTDVKADISAKVETDVTDKEHYKVTVTGGGTNIAAGGTTTVTVKVELIKSFADSATAETAKTFTVTATGTAVE